MGVDHSSTSLQAMDASSPLLVPFALGHNESLTVAQRRYLVDHPVYAQTSPLDRLRRREFKRLKSCHAYLDYTGAGLYPESLVRHHADILNKHVFGNPHSTSPSSMLSSACAQAARAAVLDFFSADASEYDVIFTANCTAALRLVGESYPFTSNASRLILPVDAHNSVNGLREFATSAGIPVQYIPMERYNDQFSALDNGGGLFAMTGQSNLSGLKSDLNLMAEAKRKGYDTLLDAAALASTTPLSLRALGNSVDAMAISLYKIIGYPTGVGCLVARKAFLAKLHKQWFSGGTVVIVQAPGNGRLLLDGHERWEDGTVNFLSLAAVPKGLEILNGYLPLLSRRLPCLMHFTLSCLASLRHNNGSPVVQLHSPSSPDAYCPKTHGAIISFSVLQTNRERVPPHEVERSASRVGIHLRSGCMCNPGAASALLGFASELADFDITSCDAQGHFDTPAAVQESYTRNENMERLVKEEGVIRVSFGLASSLTDCGRFIEFVRTFIEAEDDALNPEKVKHMEEGRSDQSAFGLGSWRSSPPKKHRNGLYKFALGLGRHISF